MTDGVLEGRIAGRRPSVDILLAKRFVLPAFFMVVVGSIVRLAALAVFLVRQIVASLAIIAAGLACRRVVEVCAARPVLADLGGVFDFFGALIPDLSAIIPRNGFALGALWLGAV